jgi:hypothetical protein
MPVKKVGKDAYKFGSSGKTYRGKGAKTKAAKQGAAIKISEAKRNGKRYKNKSAKK